MKKHLVKLSLALLSAVFILGCQDQGSGVVGLDSGPQFDKKGSGTCDAAASGGHCHGDEDPEPEPEPIPRDSFNVTFKGDIAGVGKFYDVPDDSKTDILTARTVTFGGPPSFPDVDLTFSESFKGQFDGFGESCFGEPLTVLGSIDQGRTTQFFFNAKAKDVEEFSDDIWYNLALFDEVFDPLVPWPPVVETIITGGTFALKHENGPGRKNACQGDGVLSFTITVTKITT